MTKRVGSAAPGQSSGRSACPGCGVVLDASRLQGNSRRTGRPGAYCPVCDAALDERALECSPSSMGASGAAKDLATKRDAQRRADAGL